MATEPPSQVAAASPPSGSPRLNVDIPTFDITPSKGWTSLRLRELWQYRELVYFLTWRDVKVRYKQASLGVAWAILQPLLTMVIFSVIFGRLAGLPSGGMPYPIFSYSGLLPWGLFAGSLQRSGTSLVGNANLLTKVYFPRLTLPLSAIGAGLVDFAIAFVVLLGMMAFYGSAPTRNVVWLPLFILLAVLTSFAVGLWLSALNVQYRDVQHAIPFLIQAWMYASPVAYSAELIPSGKWQFIYALNPMVGVIAGFRWALLGSGPPDKLIFVSAVAMLVLLVAGLFYFRRMEQTFADVI